MERGGRGGEGWRWKGGRESSFLYLMADLVLEGTAV